MLTGMFMGCVPRAGEDGQVTWRKADREDLGNLVHVKGFKHQDVSREETHHFHVRTVLSKEKRKHTSETREKLLGA